MTHALQAALLAAQAYQADRHAERDQPIPAPLIRLELDGEAIGRLTAPTVSEVIAQRAKRQRFAPGGK